MGDSVSLVLVGAGGMGSCYLNALFRDFASSNVVLRGVVEPRPERSASYEELLDRGISLYPTLFDFYRKSPPVDLAIIASPVHYHVIQSIFALRRGSCVLCEKPVSATVQDARRLIAEARSTRLWVKIGYQWSFSEAIRTLKEDIIRERFGRALCLKTLCFWSRDLTYFHRNNWAGKIKDEEGHWVLDSPANNAMAHFLHNAFYILGERRDSSAMPHAVTAELYRAYPVENYDTIACRAWTVEGTEILFYASHSTYKDLGPMFTIEFEKGIVSFGEDGDTIVAHTDKGEEIDYGSPEKNPFQKLSDSLSAVHSVRPIICGPDASVAQTLCVNGIQESMPTVCSFPEAKVKKDKSRIWADGLAEEFYECYKRKVLPSESGLSWAIRGKRVELDNYDSFPRGIPIEGE